MSEVVVAALIAATPPTIMAYVAVRAGRKAETEAAGANRAVNHQGADAPTLVQMVKDVDQRTAGLVDEVQTLTAGQDRLQSGLDGCAVAVSELDRKVDRHLAAHQIQADAEAARHHEPHGGT